MSAAPMFALPTEEEEYESLSQFGVDLSSAQPAARIDATASDLLRLIARERAEADRYTLALAGELEQIAQRYRRLIDPHVQRAQRYEAWVCELALSADFGKKKSREVGYGTYGVRRVPARLSVPDPAALLAWAKTQAPDLIQQKIDERVPHKLLEARYKDTGELPPGTEYEPEREQPFAKPNTESAAPSAAGR